MRLSSFFSTIFVLLGMLFTSACSAEPSKKNTESSTTERKISMELAEAEALAAAGKLDTATFGGGCFWCTEAIYQRLDGVYTVVSGYAGGTTVNPTYEEVCSGKTGHAECIRITYDPTKVSYDEVLKVFWKTHDPTTLNRQGNDVGTQYRSIVFYHNDTQKQLAEKYKKELNASGAYNNPVVTEVVAMPKFYPAEKYHQNYFNTNPNQGYCAFVVRPKVEKFEAVFKDKLKK
jgi:peptide-methionine (S)-S-oxide reductase